MYYFDFGDTDNLELESIKKTFTTESGVTLILEIFYNNTTGHLYMNVYNENEESVALGIKLVQEIDLFAKFAYLFSSDIYAVILPSTSDYEYEEVTIDNFNSGVKLFYYESV
jgi:hypothetical protein